MNNNNWDLHAVVRGCCSSAITSFTATTTKTADLDTLSCLNSSLSSSLNKDDKFLAFPEDPFEELHVACKPFLPTKYKQPEHPQNSPISSSVTCSIPAPEKEKQPQILEGKRKFSQVVPLTTATTTNSSASTTSQPHRSKRRKNQHKKVCHVQEDALSSDIWAWRKYGQKPIKGSPYPRGYYRCSSSKGCLARKQVERNRSDPTMFIVTYTAEHNHPAPTHRNSLAGSTRQKPNANQVAAAGGGDEQASSAKEANQQESCSSPGNSGGSVDEEELVMKTENTNVEDTIEDEEDELVGVSDMSMSDDFFDGLDNFIAPTAGDCFSDRFSAAFGMNWAVNGSAATAAGGG